MRSRAKSESESVLYAHFPGKRAIFDAALELGGQNVTVIAIAALDTGQDRRCTSAPRRKR
ncbi:hypothetical protein [Spongiactinospora rosea]|uniref:hypothetical protein n=1 Tax=Spongiactinospora rosea TaxID=2248750 RepID=UPI001CED1187|nr:hypothetical protein [Spongiactinospora rosea]